MTHTGLLTHEEARLLEGSTEDTSTTTREGGERDYSLYYEPSTTFGEGSLLDGTFFQGPITVTEDENINLQGTEPTESGTVHLFRDTDLEEGSNLEFIQRQFDNVPGGGPADVAIDWTRNLGPDWLDEATIAIAVLVVLVLLAPYAELGANVSG